MVSITYFETTDEWMKARKAIGGSDAAALVGLNPYKTNIDLWREKTVRDTASGRRSAAKYSVTDKEGIMEFNSVIFCGFLICIALNFFN